MPHVQSAACTTPSKPVRTARSNTTSTSTSSSSKESTSSMDKTPVLCFQDFRNHAGGGGASQIDDFACGSRRQDPFCPGQHMGKRTQDLFNHLIDIDDKMDKADNLVLAPARSGKSKSSKSK